MTAPAEAPPLVPGSPVAEAVYRVLTGQRQVNVVVRDEADHIETAAAVGYTLSVRSPWMVRLCSDPPAKRRSLIKAVNRLSGVTDPHPFGHRFLEGQPLVSVGQMAFPEKGLVNIVMSDPANPQIIRRIIASKYRAVFITTTPTHHLSDIVAHWATSIPLDIVLAGAPADQWVDEPEKQ